MTAATTSPPILGSVGREDAPTPAALTAPPCLGPPCTASVAGPLPVPSVALAVLAAALLLVGGRGAVGRLRSLNGSGPPAGGTDDPVLRPVWVAVAAAALGALGWTAAGLGGAAVGVLAGAGAGWVLRRVTAGDGNGTQGPALAAAWELLAVCLQAGLPVATATGAAATSLGGDTGRRLRRVAGLLELGSDPAQAWESTAHHRELAAFARAAGRSAGTGAALAQVARGESERIRTGLLDAAEARAQRAGVLVTGPLGLCFLPAFLVLGIAPVVIGLAGGALARW